jgi:hypothetical protein
MRRSGGCRFQFPLPFRSSAIICRRFESRFKQRNESIVNAGELTPPGNVSLSIGSPAIRAFAAFGERALTVPLESGVTIRKGARFHFSPTGALGGADEAVSWPTGWQVQCRVKPRPRLTRRLADPSGRPSAGPVGTPSISPRRRTDAGRGEESASRIASASTDVDVDDDDDDDDWRGLLNVASQVRTRRWRDPATGRLLLGAAPNPPHALAWKRRGVGERWRKPSGGSPLATGCGMIRSLYPGRHQLALDGPGGSSLSLADALRRRPRRHLHRLRCNLAVCNLASDVAG